MDDLLKNPLMLGAIVLIGAAVLLAGKHGGGQGTVAVTGGTTAADMKARAEAQAIIDNSQNAARQSILAAALGYTQAKDSAATANYKIATDAATAKYTTDSQERLGMAGFSVARDAMASQERLGIAQLQSTERVTKMQEGTKQQGQVLGFFGGIVKGVLGLFGL